LQAARLRRDVSVPADRGGNATPLPRTKGRGPSRRGPPRGTTPDEWARVRHAISLLTLAFFVPVAAGASGCVSNEYVIPHEELVHVASLSPEARGARVHAVQSIGERRAEAIEPPIRLAASPVAPVVRGARADAPEPEGDAVVEADSPAGADGEVDLPAGPDIHIEVDGVVGQGPDGLARRVGPRARLPRGRTGGWVGPAPTRAPHAAHTGPTMRGSPAAGVAKSIAGGGGGGGGGDHAGEALVVLAVVAVAVAAFAMIGLMASEGSRFDGHVEISPDQPIHLEYGSGGEEVVPFGAITEVQAARAATARVMDDEGSGLRLLDHPLDRRGFAFKLDFGTLAFQPDTSNQTFNGLTSHVQVGYFITPRIGLLATAGLGGADDGLSATLTRHELGLELQAFPGALGPVHFGAYANGGMAVLGTTAQDGTTATGPVMGGGLLLELDVTGRMALTLRAGADAARLDGGWSPAATVAAGVAIY